MALFANWRVEKVYAEALNDGLIQIINLIFPCPSRESLKIRVSFEFLNGIWVLDFSIKAEIQWPKHDKLPLMFVSYCILIYFSAGDRSEGILNFYEPAKSTILREEWIIYPFYSCFYKLIWKMEWDLELWAFPWVDPVALFFRPAIKYYIAYCIVQTSTFNKSGIEISPFFDYLISRGAIVLLYKSNIF